MINMLKIHLFIMMDYQVWKIMINLRIKLMLAIRLLIKNYKIPIK